MKKRFHRISSLSVIIFALNTAHVQSVPESPTDTGLDTDSISLPVTAVIGSKDIRMRAAPSTENSSAIVDVLPLGTAVTLTERAPEKLNLMNHAGYWFKVTTASGKQGWVYSKFLIGESSPILQENIQKTLKNLWFHKPQLEGIVKKAKETPPNQVREYLKGIKPTAYHYVAYHLLAEQHPNSLAVLIEFMNPAHKGTNQKDPTYVLNWEILSRMTPDQMFESTYETYAKFWDETGANYKVPFSKSAVFSVLSRVKQTEDNVYRR